ncbi:uncharacterized protein C8Q71DRAFT_862285 [Rhodofomes roseus]|uniref:F-box domain-containing protein n=1 Tax=Rhodofomes roseus TaxID=34475 RepID=A0ABQ8K299_9APHY|nr:uncharacterized protein C8Q71DRAFT_862285 [Rhodofomes roseus]KAH9830843.1 hypothetical protein C8Q71DRAFT_862285 [Rhodofomes roseus]
MSAANALQIVEIVCAISEQFAIEHHKTLHRGKCRRDLAHFAQVSKAFVDPALRVLWRVLPGVDPLLRLLPCVGEERVGHPAGVAQIFLKRAFDSKEWQRVQHYAGYVHAIDHVDNIRLDCGFKGRRRYRRVEPALQQLLILSTGGEPLLPRLQRLVWCPTDIGLLVDPPPFSVIGPSIQHFTLHYLPPSEGRSHGLATVLAAVAALAPGLRTLALYQRVVQELRLARAHEDALLTIARCTQLRQLKILASQLEVTSRFFDALATLPSLESLRLEVSQVDAVAGQRRALAALEALELTAPDDMIANFIQFVSLPSLRKLSLCFDAQDINAATIYGAWARRSPAQSWPSTVRILRLRFPFAFPGPGTTLVEVIQPVLELHNLEEFNVEARLGIFDWSDDDALLISQAWPRLTAFLLRVDQGKEHESRRSLGTFRPSQRALLHFAEHCPNLEQLVIPCIVDPNAEYLNLTAPRPHNRLKVLLLAIVDVECERCFARDLVKLFPNLRADRRPKTHVRFPYHKDYDSDFWELLREKIELKARAT